MSRSLLKKRANESKEIEIWSDEKSLFQDNIKEVMEKFDSIDPEIWGKIVYMEKNRRLAKAYARSSCDSEKESIIRITNSNIGFDGLTIGLFGFVNPYRDEIILQALSHLDQGVDIVMEECGNIIVHNQTESRIFLRGYNLVKAGHKRSDGLGTISLLPHQRETLFDINCYLDSIESKVGTTINLISDRGGNNLTGSVDVNNNIDSVNCEETDVYSIRRALELETISLICLGRETPNLIETPSYLIIINIVALDILKAKIPSKYQRRQSTSNGQRRRSLGASGGQRTGGHKLRPSLNLPALIRSSSPTISKSSSKDNISSSSSTNSSASIDLSSNNLLQPPYKQFNYNNQSPIGKVNHNYQSSSLRNLHLPSSDQHHHHHHQCNQHNQSSTINQLNKFISTNQLQSTDRSRSWSILTSNPSNNLINQPSNHQLPSIRLPEPDYDDNNNRPLTKSTNHYDNQFNSLGPLGIHSLVDYNQSAVNYNQQSPSQSTINLRSKSFHDLLSDTQSNVNPVNWKMNTSSSSRNQSRSSTLLTKLKLWKS